MKVLSYTVDQSCISPDRLKEALVEPDFKVEKKEEKWYSLVKKLPCGIRAALLAELNLGNYVNSIQYANWPQEGSILVSLGMPFKQNFASNRFDVKMRTLNDAHYWKADVYQTVNGVDYLIIY